MTVLCFSWSWQLASVIRGTWLQLCMLVLWAWAAKESAMQLRQRRRGSRWSGVLSYWWLWTWCCWRVVVTRGMVLTLAISKSLLANLYQFRLCVSCLLLLTELQNWIHDFISNSLIYISCVGCSDFNTYEDALRWYEYYKPFYGDVAKLDRDNDGIPCPGLPHTKNQDQYRMKVPSSSSSSSS